MLRRRLDFLDFSSLRRLSKEKKKNEEQKKNEEEQGLIDELNNKKPDRAGKAKGLLT